MGGLAELGFSLPNLIAQIVSFVLLFILLKLFAFKPIMRIFDERSRKIKESMEQTEQIKQQAAHAQEEVEKRIAAALKEGQDLIARATRASEEMRQKLVQDAKQEAEALVSRARAEIQQERDQAVSEVRNAFADLTIKAAEKVIDRSLDKEAHRQVIDKVLEESTTLKKGK